MKLVASLVLVLVACGERRGSDVSPSLGSTAATAPAASGSPKVVAASASACAAAIRNLMTFLPAAPEAEVQEDIARCEKERWPAAFVQCATEVRDPGTYGSRCFKLMFPEGEPVTVGRTFDAGADNSGMSPPPNSLDGDFAVYNQAQRCGFLLRKRYPAEAVYLMCGDKVFAGPLTTEAEIEAVTAELMRQSRQAHDLQMSLMKQWPQYKTVQVYDSVGNYKGTRVE